MAKKKNRAKRRKKQQQRTVKITQRDIEQGHEAIKTMVKGAVFLGLFICFFALKIGDQTMYERLGSLFSADEATQLSTTEESSSSP